MIGIVNDDNKVEDMKDFPVEQEQTFSAQQLQNALGQLAVKTGSLVDAIGVVEVNVKRHETEIRTLEEQQKSTDQKIEDLTEYIKETEYVKPPETREFDNSITSRVADLLRSINRIDDKYLWGCMKRKCWSDCKRYSMMVGTGGVYTQHRHYNEVLNYIGGWEPEGYGGLTGYINHMDIHKGV